MKPKVALTVGEPAGIGPDLAIKLAQVPHPCKLAIIGDPSVLTERAALLGLPLTITEWRGQDASPGQVCIIPTEVIQPVTPGRLDPANSPQVLQCLDQAIDGCVQGKFDAMVTGPVHKGAINDAGIEFTGHTEYIAERTGSKLPVMLLATQKIRVALVTTHVPLHKVSSLITRDLLRDVIEVLIRDLGRRFGLSPPRIGVCGLNPHAGESGYLGTEEIEIIGPVVEQYRREGYPIFGPLAADTVFVEPNLRQYDVVLSMYHDQGLPVIKHHGFDQAVNVTLGVPVLRTSVDHGTALDLAGSGRIDVGSSLAAVNLAIDLVRQSVRC